MKCVFLVYYWWKVSLTMAILCGILNTTTWWHILVVKIDQLTLRCYRLPAESYSQRGQRARCFPQESAKFPKDTFSRNDSIYLYETPFWILKSVLYKETDRIVVGYAADFIITAFFQYISTLRLKFHTLRYEFQTLPTKLRIIKQEP